MAAAGPRIPSVTLDDLLQFHAKHLGRSFNGVVLPGSEDYHQGQDDMTYDEQGDYLDDEDDRLGYYSDGVKRTLTDEQIAIFRHSEIQRLLLKKEREDEAKAEAAADLSDGELDETTTARVHDVTTMATVNTDIVKPTSTIKTETNVDDPNEDDDDIDDDDDYARFLEEERQQFALDAEKKREQSRAKQHQYQQQQPLDRTVSTRRRVRELDDVDKQQDVVLDY